MSRAHSPILRVALLVIAVLLFGVAAPLGTARAENLGPGGGTRILVGDQIVGPYRLYITVSPEPAYVGKLTFVVRISDPVSDQKVLDADISVELTHNEDGAKLTGKATHKDAGNPIDYAAHIPVERTGAYEGVIRISGSAGDVEIPFVEQVVPKRGVSGLILTGLPFFVVLALLGGIWYARAGSHPTVKQEGKSTTPSP